MDPSLRSKCVGSIEVKEEEPRPEIHHGLLDQAEVLHLEVANPYWPQLEKLGSSAAKFAFVRDIITTSLLCDSEETSVVGQK